MGTGSFPGVKSGRDVTLTPHPLLVPWPRQGRAIPLPLLWTVRPVQSLSACTRVHFTFTLSQTVLKYAKFKPHIKITGFYLGGVNYIVTEDLFTSRGEQVAKRWSSRTNFRV